MLASGCIKCKTTLFVFAGAILPCNRSRKAVQLDNLDILEIDHVISLRELDVNDPKFVQLWRSLAMWDPMAKDDNLRKGAGHHVCIMHESAESQYINMKTRRAQPLNQCSDLQQRWQWVKDREEILKKGKRCPCGVCILQNGNLDETQMDEVQMDEVRLYRLSEIYFEMLLSIRSEGKL